MVTGAEPRSLVTGSGPRRRVCYSVSMDEAKLLLHLAEAEDHVTRGALLLERQSYLALELERDGHNPAPARRLLALFEAVQVLHLATRDRLLHELGGGIE